MEKECHHQGNKKNVRTWAIISQIKLETILKQEGEFKFGQKAQNFQIRKFQFLRTSNYFN